MKLNIRFKKSINIILFCVISFCCLSIVIACQETKPANVRADQHFKTEAIEVYEFNQYGMTIAQLSGGFDLIYIPEKADVVKTLAEKQNYQYVINGSFFDGTYAKAKHAGWLWILGQNYASIKQDPQLTHVAVYNTKTQQLQFVDYQNFTPSRSNGVTEFQSGPIVVENNQVAKNYIANSLNGSAPYTRSLLATTDDKTKYFITVRKPVRLDDLANYLLSLQIFVGKRLNVLNLDGGPSVALYSKELSNLRYNDTAQLPILLGIR
ncbi:MAG: phosphodiester glycosidase family protein [Trichocoleus desertorum ATA4-8-CV12]|jgi:hypothetical protein|nr:phosphodiester glycosidase family protein [Trichocoleus desertorum ATA4-8-CV12]